MSNYYQLHRDTLLPKQIEYERDKYENNQEFMLFKRVQSRINNHFKSEKHKAEDLLSCSPKFFFSYIHFCLKDTRRARIDLSKINLHHVTPLESDPDNLDLWHFTNIMPVLESENLRQGSNRDREKEEEQLRRVIRFLKSIQLK